MSVCRHSQPRTWGLLCPRLAAAVGCLLLLAANRSAGAAAQPDYFAARAFGYALQEDFAQRHSKALVERIDSAALRRRIFLPLGAEVADHPSAHEAWEQQVFPALLNELESLDKLPTLVMSRVLLADGARTIECVLLDEKGSFRMVTLRLRENPGGAIKIEDLHFLGSSLPYSRATRQMFLLMGVPSTVALEPEEIDLERFGRKGQLTVSWALRAWQRGDAEEAFRLWSLLPDELKTRPVWQDTRNRIALSGGTAAMRSLMEEWRQNLPGNAFLRYSLAQASNDNAAAITAIDQLLIEVHQAPFVRAVKASLLLTDGRPAEAFEQAWDVCELNPFSGLAYYVAVRAAVENRRPENAMMVLQRWAHVLPTAAIDKIVAAEPLLAPLRASAAYVSWQQMPGPATAVTAPPPPSPPPQ